MTIQSLAFSLAWLLICLTASCPAQTKLKLSAIKPGTEKVRLVPNGNFQLQGPISSGSFPTPPGWNRIGDEFTGTGLNAVAVNQNIVAVGRVDGSAPACGYTQAMKLEPATGYVFSAYIWNLGNAADHVTAVIDLNDAPGEPQVTLDYPDSEAERGYFVYRSFNTSTTGTDVVVRAFHAGKVGRGAATAYYPAAAQWDNIAITKASEFIAPQASNSGATVRPLVSITTPIHGTAVLLGASEGGLVVNADATDLDGSVANVQFFAGTIPIGQATASPWSVAWSGVTAGTHVLTALATDNSGSTGLSPPVTVSVTMLPARPILGPLAIHRDGSDAVLSWPEASAPMVVQANPDLLDQGGWQRLNRPIVLADGQNTMRVPAAEAQRFFRGTAEVDPRTLHHKLLMGYQGWFACAGDGSPPNQWIHWFRSNSPTAVNLTVDMWPDMSELDADELFPTSLTYSNGTIGKLYSAYNRKTVMRHFKWMQDYHLDGVILQRFLTALSGSVGGLFDQVATNVQVGAEAHGRTFAIMYDISGYPTAGLIDALRNDWTYLVNSHRITNSPAYLHHNGKPVVAIWGFGFSGRPDTPAQCVEAINWFKAAGCTVLGGVPSYWRTLSGDAQSDPAWSEAFRAFDIISPWSVGRYSNSAGADGYRANVTEPDLADCTSHGIEYLPVVFPGFTWTNLTGGPSNQIPRYGGSFYWRQVYNAVDSNCSMIYGAMFDEVDEGTAMFKIAPTPDDQPENCNFVPLNVDGYNLPSDWYLRLANQAGKMLRREIPLQSTIPISP